MFKTLFFILIFSFIVCTYPKETIRIGYIGITSNIKDDSLLIKSSQIFKNLFKSIQEVELIHISDNFSEQILTKCKFEAKKKDLDFFIYAYIEETPFKNTNNEENKISSKLFFSYPWDSDKKILIENRFNKIKKQDFISHLLGQNETNIENIKTFISNIKPDQDNRNTLRNKKQMPHFLIDISKKAVIITEDTRPLVPNAKLKTDNRFEPRHEIPISFKTPTKEIEEIKNKTRIVILNLRHYNISENIIQDLNDSLMNQFTQSPYFEPVIRNDLDSIFKAEDYKSIGKLSGASKIITGTVGKLGDIYSFTLKITDVNTGENEKIVNFREKGTIKDLFYLIYDFYKQTSPMNKYNKNEAFEFMPVKANDDPNDPNIILKLLEEATYISESNKFTNPKTNMFSVNHGAGYDGAVFPYDIIDITKGMVCFLPFYKPANINSTEFIHKSKNVKYVKDRFFNDNSAAEFYSGNSYIELKNDTMNLSRTISIALNLKISKYPKKGYAAIINKSDGAKSTFSLNIDSAGNLLFFSTTGNVADSLIYSSISLNKWYHIILTLDRFDGEMIMYINNIKVKTGQAQFSESDTVKSPILISKHPNSYNPKSFCCTVGDIKIYDRVLNDSEIHCLYYEKDWKFKALVMSVPCNNSIYEATRNTNNIGWDTKIIPCKDRYGKENNAFRFLEKESCIDFTSFSYIYLCYKFSLTLWFNISKDNQTEAFLFDKYHPEVKNGYRLSVVKEGDNAYKLIYIQDGDSIRSLNSFTPDDWHLASVTYDNGKIKLFIDGNKDNEIITKRKFSHNGTSICLGNNHDRVKIHPFKGDLDDFRIYFRTLCENEIKLIYNENNWCK